MALLNELVDSLKRTLKSRGITYAVLARQLDISEATVKRMFSTGAISLKRLDEICQALDIGLSELATEARSGRDPLAELSVEQEQALVDDPALMLAMYLVLNRWQQDEVLARYKLSTTQWTLLLAKLDRLGVIELLPGNRTRPRTQRNFRWRREGPMQRFFQQRLLPEYFGRSFGGEQDQLLLLSGMVSPASAALVDRRLKEAAEAFDLLMEQDAKLPAAERVGVSLVLARRPWNLTVFSDLRKGSEASAKAE